MLHPLVAVALVLTGYAFVHQHSPDVWFYRVLADNMWSSGDALHLHFTDTLLRDFHDHLPWSLWPLALARGLGGEALEHVLYGGMSLATFALALLLARRVGEREAMWTGLWLLPFSENFMRLQPQGRVDQPFVLAFVAALTVVGRGERVRHLVAAALCTGIALCIRPPFALALFALVPLSVWAQRDGAISPQRDAWRYLSFAALASMLPIASHVATRDVWPPFLHEQVFASLAGHRSDGATSHFGALHALARTYWPGLPPLLLGVVLALRERRRGQVLFLVWAAAVLFGLSLGGRHFPHYAWMAYPALLALSGAGLCALALPWRRWLGGFAIVVAAGFALLVALVQRPSTCELVRAQLALAGRALCPTIATSLPYEFSDAALIVGHLRHDLRFDARPSSERCDEVFILPADAATSLSPIDRGRRYRIALDPRAQP